MRRHELSPPQQLKLDSYLRRILGSLGIVDIAIEEYAFNIPSSCINGNFVQYGDEFYFEVNCKVASVSIFDNEDEYVRLNTNREETKEQHYAKPMHFWDDHYPTFKLECASANEFFLSLSNKNTGELMATPTIGKVVNQNKDAAIIAARIKGGEAVLKLVKEVIKPHVPIWGRGYMDSPFVDIILANILMVCSDLTDKKYDVLNISAEITMEAAFMELMNKIDVEALVSKLGSVIPTEVLKSEDK